MSWRAKTFGTRGEIAKHNKLNYDDLEDIPEPEESDQDSNAHYLFTAGHCLPNQLLYSISFLPFYQLRHQSQGVKCLKLVRRVTLLAGFMKELFQPWLRKIPIENEQSQRYNVAAISALAMMTDTAFAENGDSGSIYYASRGSFWYPFAILHNGEGYQKNEIPTTGFFQVPENKLKTFFLHKTCIILWNSAQICSKKHSRWWGGCGGWPLIY